MPDTAIYLACGSNLHQQLRNYDDETGEPLALSSFVPVPTDGERVNQILAVSASQIAYSVTQGSGTSPSRWCRPELTADSRILLETRTTLSIAGFRPEPCLQDKYLEDALEARSWLGKDYFRALLSQKGDIVSLEKPSRTSARFNAAAMDSHGRVLALSAGRSHQLASLARAARLTSYCPAEHELRLFNALEDIYRDKYHAIGLPARLDLSLVTIYAGAAHFMILVRNADKSEEATMLLGLGDNRFFQQGHQGQSSWTKVTQVMFFDEITAAVVKVACGDLHTAFLTADGALHMAGSDAKGQCGGFAQQEPSLVEWEVDGTIDQEVDVFDVACGSNHTVALTSKGLFSTGSSKSCLLFLLPD